MSSVIESGNARCPRCMAIADYTFREGDGALRYEVACRACQHVHLEECAAAAASAA